MTTATLVPQKPASLLKPTVHRRCPTILKRPRLHEVKKSASDTKPVLLRNLRHYYARRRPSMSISNKAAEEPTVDRKVQFFPRVRVKRIPHRLAYPEEERLSLWVPKKELKRMIMTNQAEYAYEGQDWEQAPEEEEFGERNGKLVHPFYIWAEQHAEDDDSSVDCEANESTGSED